MTGDSALFVTDDEGRYLAANDSGLDAPRLHAARSCLRSTPAT